MPGMSKITEHCVYQPNPKVLSLPNLKTSAVYFALQYTTTFVHRAAKKGLAKSKQGVGRKKIECVRERQC